MDAARFTRLLEKLGTDGMNDLDQWLDEKLRDKGVTRDEYREILSRLDLVDKRLDTLDKRDEELRDEIRLLRAEMNERLGRMEERLGRMEERLDQMYIQLVSSVRWTVGTIAAVGTLIAVLITIFKFAG